MKRIRSTVNDIQRAGRRQCNWGEGPNITGGRGQDRLFNREGASNLQESISFIVPVLSGQQDSHKLLLFLFLEQRMTLKDSGNVTKLKAKTSGKPQKDEKPPSV